MLHSLLQQSEFFLCEILITGQAILALIRILFLIIILTITRQLRHHIVIASRWQALWHCELFTIGEFLLLFVIKLALACDVFVRYASHFYSS